MWWITLVFALLLLRAPSQSLADATIEHSLEGLFFTEIGTIQLDPDSEDARGSAKLVREAWSDSDIKRLQAAVTDDGLYTVRVSLLDGSPVSTSIPAACLAEHLGQEEWALHLDDRGRLVSVQVATPEGLCSKEKALQALSGGAGSLLAQSATHTVALKVPEAAVEVLAGLGEGPGVGGVGGQQQQQQQQQRQGSQQQVGSQPGGPGPGSNNSTQAAAPPDDRTWWQRNWVFVMAGGVMVLNMVLKATVGDLPQQPGQPAGRPAPRR